VPTAPLLLFGAGLLAGGMNALAGGGSFVTLPALVLAGLPSTVANASSTVALLPGAFASSWAYRRDFSPLEGVPIRLFLVISVLGGLAGAALLLVTTASAFDRIVPWLMLTATAAFAFGPRLGAILRRRGVLGPGVMIPIQAALSVYGGYFGGGVGIMMLAAWSLLVHADLKVLNPYRILMIAACNVAAAGFFIVAGAVSWPATLTMLAGTVAGGYAGAHLARRLPLAALRAVTIGLGALMTVLFFLPAA
jgi:uncharacterized membrane protein YfcA